MIQPIKDTSGRTHKKFDETFKREAVANWLSSGKSARVIGEELGISPGRSADLQSQLEAALRENRHLREQRAILKKTLGILSEPSSTATNGSTR